jgi:hypothetical protein
MGVLSPRELLKSDDGEELLKEWECERGRSGDEAEEQTGSGAGPAGPAEPPLLQGPDWHLPHVLREDRAGQLGLRVGEGRQADLQELRESSPAATPGLVGKLFALAARLR